MSLQDVFSDFVLVVFSTHLEGESKLEAFMREQFPTSSDSNCKLQPTEQILLTP